MPIRELLVEVAEKNVEGLRLLSVVLDNNARALDGVAWVSLSVVLAETSPLSEIHLAGDLEELNLVLIAQGLNEATVGRFIAVRR